MDQDLVLRAQKGDQQAFEALALSSHARLGDGLRVVTTHESVWHVVRVGC